MGVRCGTTTQVGAPCRQWALSGTDPPRCSQHEPEPDAPSIMASDFHTRQARVIRLIAAGKDEREILAGLHEAGDQLSLRALREFMEGQNLSPFPPQALECFEAIRANRVKGTAKELGLRPGDARRRGHWVAWFRAVHRTTLAE